MDYLKELQVEIDAITKGFVQALPLFAIAIVILIITWGIARFAGLFADRVTAHTHMREDLQQLVETMSRLLIWLVGIMIAATVVIPGLTPASLFAGLGVGALAIGFAFQDIFENFLAGVLIMVREKMRIHDLIECEGIYGRVEKISLRETHIRQLTNELIIVPNSMLFKNAVKVLTDAPIRRDQIVVGVSYDTDLEQAQAVIQKAVESSQYLAEDKPVLVFAQEFNSSSIDFLVQWWTQSAPRDMRLTKSEIVLAVKKALDDAGIEIPFPYVTNTFKEPLPLTRAQNDAA